MQLWEHAELYIVFNGEPEDLCVVRTIYSQKLGGVNVVRMNLLEVGAGRNMEAQYGGAVREAG